MGGTGTKTMAPVPKLWHRCQVSGTGATKNKISGTGTNVVAPVPIFGTGARTFKSFLTVPKAPCCLI